MPLQISCLPQSGEPMVSSEDLSGAVYWSAGHEFRRLSIPNPNRDVLPGMPWGRPEEIFTPAYWRAQVWFAEQANPKRTFALGQTLAEELVACLLGGYGVPAEINYAAFVAVREAGLIREDTPPDARQLEKVLRTPLQVGGRTVAYRFVVQRARYVSAALRALPCLMLDGSPGKAIRDHLLALPGVGYKTASWIVRNHFEAEDVAIIDVHVRRAGLLIGLFEEFHDPARHYRIMENRFLCFAEALGVRTSLLDAVIWSQMREAGAWTRSLHPYWPARLSANH
jgi:N-glycosylase/DNA lyase